MRAPQTASTSKYKAKPCMVDHIRFASQKEARRYQELKVLEKAGVIRGLELQPRFKLRVVAPNGETPVVAEYRADFRYDERTGSKHLQWRMVVEDVKGVRTPVYRLKKKMAEATYDIEIRET